MKADFWQFRLIMHIPMGSQSQEILMYIRKYGNMSDRRAAKNHIIIIREGELKQRITEVQLYI